MENWGLVTYRETALFYDPNSSSDASKQSTAVTVSHELAHQWVCRKLFTKEIDQFFSFFFSLVIW